MSTAAWMSGVSIVGMFVLVAIVALDRNHLRQQVHNAEGRLTGLSLDLAATRASVAQLQTYLNSHDSWAVDAEVPPELRNPEPDRWSPPRASTPASQVQPLANGD